MLEDNDGIRQLLAMACLLACSDYKKAVKNKKEKVIKECREFFASDYFQFFVNYSIPPEEIEKILLEKEGIGISYLRKNVKNKKPSEK